MDVAFFVSGVLAAAAGVLVFARLEADVPEVHEETPAALPDGVTIAPAPRAPSGSILWRIKAACFATFAYGYFQASVVLFLPLYLVEQKGVPTDQTILVPAFFAAGMLLFTNIAGRIGDARGHLALMRVLAIIGFFMILGFVYLDAFAVMCVAVFIAGAALASISPLSLALQGVVTRPHELSRANALYNVFYAAGMLIGPPISSSIFQSHGGISMLYHLAALWAAFILFTVVFRRDDPRARAV
jgi:MFS family permease